MAYFDLAETLKQTRYVLAESIVDRVAEKTERDAEKKPHAVALGRFGGLKGGKARASKLTQEQCSEIARKATLERWTK